MMYVPELGKLFTTTKALHLSLLVFAVAVFTYNLYPQTDSAASVWFGFGIYLLGMLNILLMIFVKSGKSLFCVLWLFISYLMISYLEQQYPQDFSLHTAFVLLMFLLPLNWLFFSFREDMPVGVKSNFYALCAILVQSAILENVLYLQVSVDNIWLKVVYGEWFLAAIILLLRYSLTNRIKDAGLFLAFISLSCAFFYGNDVFSVSYFFCITSLILLLSNLQSSIYAFFRDELTGVYSRNTYERNCVKHFPLKYSIGIICIDDYGKLLRVFGRFKTDRLVRMIVMSINEHNPGADMYRYNEDEFILIFNNTDLKTGYNYLEDIRRGVAGAEFMLSSNHAVKATVSQCISEKKRSDIDAAVVLKRVRQAVQKAYKFTQNITTKA